MKIIPELRTKLRTLISADPRSNEGQKKERRDRLHRPSLQDDLDDLVKRMSDLELETAKKGDETSS